MAFSFYVDDSSENKQLIHLDMQHFTNQNGSLIPIWIVNTIQYILFI